MPIFLLCRRRFYYCHARRGVRKGERKGRLNYACQWSALSPRVAICNGRLTYECACVCVFVCVSRWKDNGMQRSHSATQAIIMGAMMARRQLFCHIKLCWTFNVNCRIVRQRKRNAWRADEGGGGCRVFSNVLKALNRRRQALAFFLAVPTSLPSGRRTSTNAVRLH